MKIVVDAMGGDHSPGAIVEGAALAVREFGLSVILVGIADRVQEELEKQKDWKNLSIEIEHADEVVTMEDSPSKVLRAKRKSSMKVGLELVKSGQGAAFVSAGNTGAVLAYSTIILRPLKGVDRPAIAVQLPTLKGSSILLDAGANVDCKTNQLFQFGIMGHVLAKYILGKENPEVRLLSIGAEEVKGNETTKEAFKLLKKSHINFTGNIEGKEIYQGRADVIVCDGFTGNVALKISESLADMIGANLKKVFNSGISTKIGYLLLKKKLTEFKKSVDYSEKGGAPLLGINGVCIIAHGGSNSKAIKNAIYRAYELIEKKINEHISEDIEANLDVKGGFWQHIKEIVSGDEDPALLTPQKKEEAPLDPEEQPPSK